MFLLDQLVALLKCMHPSEYRIVKFRIVPPVSRDGRNLPLSPEGIRQKKTVYLRKDITEEII